MATDVTLSAAIRSNLLLLQNTQSGIDRTQGRLSTGKKINTAVDGPQAFFAAKGLSQRSGDLLSLKDQMGQAVSTMKAADRGITDIEKYVEQARGLTTQALNSLGDTPSQVATRKTLANSYNEILRQIDSVARDSGYAGKNLLLGSGLQYGADFTTTEDVNGITGISGARVTNVVAADSYSVSVGGTGAITANADDIVAAEAKHGLSNIKVEGSLSGKLGNYSSVSIEVIGGVGQNKTFVLTEGSQSFTITRTQDQWLAAKELGTALQIGASFASGTAVSFEADFDKIEAVATTAGVGKSTIEKNYDLAIAVANQSGVRVTRDGDNLAGQRKLAAGENAFAFDTGTVRLDVNEKTLLRAINFNQALGPLMGGPAGLAVNDFSAVAAQATQDVQFKIYLDLTSASVSSGSSGIQKSYALTIDAGTYGQGTANFSFAPGTATTTFNVSVGAATDFTFQLAITPSLLGNYQNVAASVGGTTSGTGGAATNLTIVLGLATATNATTGINANKSLFLKDTQYALSMDYDSNTSSFSTTLTDGDGESYTITGLTAGTYDDVEFKVGGSKVVLDFVLAGTEGGETASFYATREIYGEGPATANFRAAWAGGGTGKTLQTEQITNASTDNDLTVVFNEVRTSTIGISSRNVQTDGQGLGLDLARNDWRDAEDINRAIAEIDTAKAKLRAAASEIGTALNVVIGREDYTKEFANILQEGADKLVLADQNEEGANMITLQTRQQLGVITLSIANQSQQSILRLF